MAAIPIPQRVIVPLAPLGGACSGLLVALALFGVPSAILEGLVEASGIAALFPAAAPPLGTTARTALAFVLGSGTGVAVWCALLLALGTRGLSLRPGEAVARLTSRAVLGKDEAAPKRAPVLATRDLGTPFLEVRAKAMIARRSTTPIAVTLASPDAPGPAVPTPPATFVAAEPAPPLERALPVDLDAPLAAYDPGAIPAVPAEPVRAVAPLVAIPPRAPEPEGRIHTFELTPPIATPKTDATIHALLERLERGVARRDAERAAAAKTAHGLQDTLAELRMLASH